MQWRNIMMKFGKIMAAALCALPSVLLADKLANTVSGKADKIDEGKYATALISNGSISTTIDNLGVQKQRKYVSFVPSVAWEGRRYGVPSDALISMGWFDTVLKVNGAPQDKPVGWTQTLSNKEAYSYNKVEYPEATVETFAFVPAQYDMLVVKKIITPKKDAAVDFSFVYTFAPKTSSKPRDRVLTTDRILTPNCATFAYTAYGHLAYRGLISIFSDAPSAPSFPNGDTAKLSSRAKASPSNPLVITYFVSYNDDFEKKDFAKESAKMRETAESKGFDGLFADNKASWAKYWEGSYIDIPNKEIEKTYYTGLYHQKCNSTKWSLPVGVFASSHWNGRFFGWDEAFNAMSLATSGKFEDSKRPSNFRKDKLPIAVNRVNKGGTKEGVWRNCGARYVWESLEDGHEGAPLGYWIEHIFHMSNIVMETWGHYLYTNDKDFLKKHYELMVECSLYYIKNHVYVNDGKYTIGKCTDLERLGAAKENPYMTSCGVIYTLERTAKAADILGVDGELAKEWRKIAAELRKTLPNDGTKYVPYPGSTDYSIGSVGGLYPYRVFDENDKLAKTAVYEFHKNIDKGGNMYDMGKSVNAWYAGWMSSALVVYNDKELPAKLLEGASKECGSFYDTYEINEPEINVRKCPWFTTGSGNYVYAVNQMLLRSEEDGRIMVATSVPDSWNDISFNLPAYGGLWVKAEIKGGKIVSIDLSAKGKGENGTKRTIVIPARFVDASKIIGKHSEKDGNFLIEAEAGTPFYK